MLNIGLLHHFEELARIGAQAFDIAALALGVDGVERQARFAAARQAGDHDQLIARQIDIHAFEIMFTRTAHTDVGQTHGMGMFQICSLRARGRPCSPLKWNPRGGLATPRFCCNLRICIVGQDSPLRSAQCW